MKKQLAYSSPPLRGGLRVAERRATLWLYSSPPLRGGLRVAERRATFWLSGLLLVALAFWHAWVPACGHAGTQAGPVRAEKPADNKAVVVPFELLKTGHMAVMVKVNGKGPYKLIFDTGAPINLFDNKIAKEAGLLKDVPRPLFTLFGSMGDVKVKEIQVGDQKAEDVAAIVMDHPTIARMSRALGDPIHGIVGFPFFARFNMTLDYQKKTMTLVPNGFDPPDVMKAMQAALMAGVLAGEQGPMVLSSPAQWGMTVDKPSGDEEAGVDVKKVLPGSAAAKAGLKEGDRLLTIDGRWTDSVPDTFRAAAAVKPGSEVPVVIKRGGKEMTLKAKPAAGF